MPSGRSTRNSFAQTVAVIREVANPNAIVTKIERTVGQWEMQRIGFEHQGSATLRSDLAPRLQQHRMREIAPEHGLSPARFQGEHQVAVPQHRSSTRASGRSRTCATRFTVRVPPPAVNVE